MIISVGAQYQPACLGSNYLSRPLFRYLRHCLIKAYLAPVVDKNGIKMGSQQSSNKGSGYDWLRFSQLLYQSRLLHNSTNKKKRWIKRAKNPPYPLRVTMIKIERNKYSSVSNFGPLGFCWGWCILSGSRLRQTHFKPMAITTKKWVRWEKPSGWI